MIGSRNLSLSIIILLSLWSTLCWSQDTSIPACVEFGSGEPGIISIPENAVSGIAYAIDNLTPLQFQLTNNTQLKCDASQVQKRQVFWNLTDEYPSAQPRDFLNRESGTSDPHHLSYFTSAGFFYDNVTSTYYAPNGDYCVSEYSQNRQITVQICAVNDDCTSTEHTLCVPKCCAVDEVLLFQNDLATQCVKLTEAEGITPWTPPVFQGPENPDVHPTQSTTSRTLFQLAKLPENCHVISFPDNPDMVFFQLAVSPRDPIKLIAPAGDSGKVRPLGYLSDIGRWDFYDFGAFCVDGFHEGNATIPYDGKEHNWIMLYCAGVEEELANEWATGLYIGVCGISLPFLVVTVIVYLMLYQKHNLHGFTILSYSVANLFSYVFLGAAHVISSHATLFEMAEARERGIGCYLNAVLAHYFFLASYFWLTIMNYDLWMVFKSMRTVKRESKEWRVKFTVYSLVAWILPAILVAIFVAINEIYRPREHSEHLHDPESQVPRPAYAEDCCFVNETWRGQYVYIPMAILLAINLLLIGLTMYILAVARKNTGSVLQNSDQRNKYNAKLFMKLFVVMGGLSLVDFLTWYYNNHHKHWIIVVVESVSYLAPVYLFFIFCMTHRILDQMREQYPKLMKTMNPLLRLCGKAETRYGVGGVERFAEESNGKTILSTETIEHTKLGENIPLKP